MALPATDSFNGTFNDTLTTYSANWSNVVGTIRITISPGIRPDNASNFSGYRWNADTFADKHYAKGVATDVSPGVNASAGVGPAIRCQSGASSFYYCVTFGTGPKAFNGECITGTGTDWDSGQTIAAGDTIEIGVDPTTATTILFKRNGSLTATYTSKSALSAGSAGVCGFDSDGGVQMTSWEGGDVAGGGGGAASKGVASMTLVGVQ